MAALPPLTQLGGNHTALLEWFWSQLDHTNSGKVDAAAAAAFLKKSQLREPILHKIWNMSDPAGNGFLDKQGLFMALRMIALCQISKEPSVANMALSDPPPKLVGMEAPPHMLNKWSLEASERTKYELIFQSLYPNNGLLGGNKVRPYMLSSKLSKDTLGKIWSLSDIDKDGSLDSEEFCIAAKLISLAQAGEILPATLPPSLTPPTKGSGPTSLLPPTQGSGPSPLLPETSPSSSTPNILPSTAVTMSLGRASPKPSSSPSRGSPLPVKANTTPLEGGDWVVTSEMKAKYDGYFQGIDTDHDGYISGDEARSLFMASNLHQAVLAHIWNLCDIEKNGKLNSEQFALAMYLIAEKVRKSDIPKELTPAMIPPSLRGKVVALSSTSTTTASTLNAMETSTWGVQTTPQTTPLLSSSASSVSTASTAWATPSSSVSNVKEEGSEFGFGSDFSSIQELDSITNDIQSIRKEKSGLSDEIKVKQELIQQRKGELEVLQGDVNQASQQREELEKKREEMRKVVNQMNDEKVNYDGQITELRQNCDDEREEIERLKLQLTEQEIGKRSQEEELESLKKQLDQLRQEEGEYKRKVELSKAELEALQIWSRESKAEINQVRQKLENLKEEQQSLSTAFSLYPMTSATPGSTPSSSVININDVGQLSSELHVPHQSEQDAISARATVGSSSPVSSLSGFSTNSHLDDAVEESIATREGEGTNKPTPDPFAAFSILSGGSGDPFGGQSFGGRPSDLSSFDPFGGAPGGGGGGGGGSGDGGSNFEAFKSGATSSAPTTGEDMFRSDPFSGSDHVTITTTTYSSASVSQAPPTSNVDPFSGQDPFNLDPFGAPGKGGVNPPSSVALWGNSSPFDSDPFAQQQTPTDPFASSDPFGSSDPFASASGGGGGSNGGNPFFQGTKEGGGGFGGVAWSKDSSQQS